MLMEHYCDVLNGLVKVTATAPPSAPRFACLVGFAFKTAVYLTLLPGHQAAFYAEDKVAAKARFSNDARCFRGSLTLSPGQIL